MKSPAGVRLTVLLIEDEAAIRGFVRIALEAHDYRVVEAEILARALIEAASCKPDLVILDLGLPDGDGTTFLKSIRKWTQIPVLVLSARTAEEDKIEALDCGADDYLTKPFSVGELLARVRALLRRAASHDAAQEDIVRFGNVEVDLRQRVVRRGQHPIHLTVIEFRLLVALIASSGKVVTHRQLLHAVWGPAHSESNHYVRVYVGRLRQKLEVDANQPRHIQTEIGVGYRFVL